jgi:hypothetical protein
MFSQASLLLALVASATAHMILEYPVPYGNTTLNSSPLAPADFPCKQRPGVYEISTMNQWNAGETKSISFMGSAVHGGGSCQFSITTDPKPTKDSQWKVIQSVIGGCPANVAGNLPSDPYGHGAAHFPVTMPSNIPDGQYTFAWTWLNKVGNREFYMNCAPIQVGSGSGSASASSASAALSALPDMFVANLPDTECSTKEGEDFSYPNPGQNVVTGTGSSPGKSMGGSGCTKQNALGSGNGQIGTPSQPETPSKPSASGKPAVTSAVAYPSTPGGVFAPGASSAPVVDTPAQPSTPVAVKPTPAPSKPSATPQPQQPQQPPKTPDNSNNNNTNGACTPCTNDGAIVCIGSKQFGLCNRGCAVAQDLALGMACSNGVIVAATKRSLNFPRAHLHRRHGASRFM